MGLPRKIKNFALFQDGVSFLGQIPELNLPKLTRKTEDYQDGGMAAPIKSDMDGWRLHARVVAAVRRRAAALRWCPAAR